MEYSLRGLVIIKLSSAALWTSTIDLEKFWMPDLAFSLQNQAFQTPKAGRQPGRIRPGFANLDFRRLEYSLRGLVTIILSAVALLTNTIGFGKF